MLWIDAPTLYNEYQKGGMLAMMTKNEATIRQLRDLLVKPNYAESAAPKKINKDLLIKKAQKISKTLDKNDSIQRPVTQ